MSRLTATLDELPNNSDAVQSHYCVHVGPEQFVHYIELYTISRFEQRSYKILKNLPL